MAEMSNSNRGDVSINEDRSNPEAPLPAGASQRQADGILGLSFPGVMEHIGGPDILMSVPEPGFTHITMFPNGTRHIVKSGR